MRSLLLLLASLLLLQQRCLGDDQAQVLPVSGKITVPDGLSFSEAEVSLVLEDGRQMLAFPLQDGTFSFLEVPVGVHVLSVHMRSLMFPTVKLDVGATRKGKIAATAPDLPGAPSLPYPLLLRPFSRMEYYEKRQVFSLMAFLKTPMGMMVAFGIFSIFIMPKLKMDEAEYKELMGQQSGSDSAAGSGAVSAQRRRSD